MERACRETKNSCSGPDGVPPELIKHCLEATKTKLAELFTKCLRHGLPPTLRHGLITLLPKTRPPSKNPAKYRPITLLPVILRILLRVVDNKIRSLIGGLLTIPVEQGGFMPNRNTHLQCFLLLLPRDFARYQQEALYAAFLDIEKAFDSINHRQLLHILLKIGVPKALVNAIHRLIPLSLQFGGHGGIIPSRTGDLSGQPPLALIVHPLVGRSDLVHQW